MNKQGGKKIAFILFLAAIIVLFLLPSCATAPKTQGKGTKTETGTSSTDTGTTAFGQSRKSTYMTSSYDDYSFTGDLFFGKGLASTKKMQSIKPEEGFIFIIFYGALFSALYIIFIIRKILAKRKRFS
jgi:hypothetical protein